MSDRSTTHATFVLERSYEADPARVFSAWSSREARARWFTPPQAAADGYELDFRVGGHERLRVETGDRQTYLYDAIFMDIVADERLVYTYEMYRGSERMSVSVATVELMAAEGGTALRLTEQGVYLDGIDTPAAREHGTGELLGALGRVLAADGVR